MSAIPFDTLKLARTLRDKARFTNEKAEGVADALADAFQDRIIAKDDVVLLRNELVLLEQRLTIKIGGMLVVAVGVLSVLLKLVA